MVHATNRTPYHTALALLILMLTWWPPPDRVFPRKKPVARLVPWCLVGRMLGYGVIDWREGKLTPFVRYFRERWGLYKFN
jgi:hypothetical protein